MRGKGDEAKENRTRERITPAYAGKRRPVPWLLSIGRDHPRVCGEKGSGIFDALIGFGSPPRMRGKVQVIELQQLPIRITPAYAGKSCSR